MQPQNEQTDQTDDPKYINTKKSQFKNVNVIDVAKRHRGLEIPKRCLKS